MLKYLAIRGIFNSEQSIRVEFREKLTLLYGINGSGKTTVLNVLAAIASGRLEALVKYEFKEVSLTYTKEEELRHIRIRYHGNGKFSVMLKGREHHVNLEDHFRKRRNVMTRDGVPPVALPELADEIALTYLPLSRDSRAFVSQELATSGIVFDYDRRSYRDTIQQSASLEESLAYVGMLAKETHRTTMFNLDKVNQHLRHNILQEALTLEETNFDESLKRAIAFVNDETTFISKRQIMPTVRARWAFM